MCLHRHRRGHPPRGHHRHRRGHPRRGRLLLDSHIPILRFDPL